MSDVKLFSLESEVRPIDLRAVKLEKQLQSLIELQMDTFFGVRFLASEYAIQLAGEWGPQGGRIDSLGIDENNCPVIFEYKRDSNENVINQGLTYLDWLVDHKADFKWLVMDRLGRDVAAMIDWSAPAVYCIASSFGKFDPHAVRIINQNVRLIRYAIGDGMLMFEYLNSPSTSARPASLTVTPSKNGKTYAQQYVEASQDMREIVDETRRYMSSLGTDVSENELQQCLAIKKDRNIVCIEILKSKVSLFLKVDPSTVEIAGNVSDVSGKGHWGTGDVRVDVRTMDELESAKPLLERAYLEN